MNIRLERPHTLHFKSDWNLKYAAWLVHLQLTQYVVKSLSPYNQTCLCLTGSIHRPSHSLAIRPRFGPYQSVICFILTYVNPWLCACALCGHASRVRTIWVIIEENWMEYIKIMRRSNQLSVSGSKSIYCLHHWLVIRLEINCCRVQKSL